MKTNPKISIIIPTYKRSHLIGRAIQSILNQTYQDFEIVIIDDSPNDDTEKVVKKINDERVRYIRNEQKTNIPAARNKGVRESNPDSKYIAFLDDDDEWLPLFLEKTVERIEEKNDLAFVTTYSELRTYDGKKLPKVHGKLDEWWRTGFGSGCLVRKEIFTKENLWFDEEMFFEDVDLGLRILQRFKVEAIPEVLRAYYYYPLVKRASYSTFTSETSAESLEYFYEKHYQTYQKIGRKAFGWLCFFTGTVLCKAGKRKARGYFLKACLIYPHPRYMLYYLISLFFPSLFRNTRLLIFKQKIFRGKI
ncbi:glycosyltransferase [Patescibacteria group bacterium]|nr:glycosyltransferase [Patescibacteria group bacterium]